MKLQFSIFIILGLLSFRSFGQDEVQPSDSLNLFCFEDYCHIDSSVKNQYPFITFEKNNFQFYSERSPNWEQLYKNLDKLNKGEFAKLNFYHIGGSHIQADIYSHDFRTFLQSNWTNAPGERGIVFPLAVAKTNNPANYTISSPNFWTSYRSVVHRPVNIDYGVMGVAMTCHDSVINFYFKHNRTSVKPDFCHLRVYHNKGELPYDLNFGPDEILIDHIFQNEQLGYTDIYFADPLSEMDLQFSRRTSELLDLEIYGFQFMNDEPGISYTSIGINGAGLYTYLANKNFEEQLALYPPDFFAFSVGTNDGNVPYDKFDPQVYKNNLEKMMQKVLRANPKCAILLTVPNDSYYHRKYLNRNIAREREVIIELAEQYQMPVWDFYGIMGELGSSKTWYREGLMQSDMVHFTSIGYHLKGALLIDAFEKYLEQMELFKKLN